MKLKIYGSLLFSFSLLVFVGTVSAQFQYISPEPGSKYHHTTTNIILRNGNLIDEASIHTKDLFRVEGSLSGSHEVACKLADGDKAILLHPKVPFMEGEAVTVTVANGLRTQGGLGIKGTSFSFETNPPRTAEQLQKIKDGYIFAAQQELADVPYSPGTIRDESDSGLPTFTITKNTNPAPGQVFFHNFNLFGINNSHYCIIESNGDSVYGKADSITFNNFDLNHNGYLTVYNKSDSVFEVLDSNYVKVLTAQMGNGYIADVHEFQMYPDRIFMMCYDPQIVDMTVYNPTYQEEATVIGCVIQELDEDFNVVFQWRSWDHFDILDATHQNFAGLQIDYVHGNTIELDTDGNLLLSCRHMDEVTKINRNTGGIVWRLGGKHNEFTFIGTTQKFSYQHDVRRTASGNITMFDNGNFYSPPRSWAKEFDVDEVNKTATLVWSYSRTVGTLNLFGSAMGSVQRLSNGNTFICWGLVYGEDFPNLTELDPANNIVWEMQLANDDAIYRAFRYVWDPCARPSFIKEKVTKITSNSAKVSWNAATNAESYELQYKPKNSSTWLTTSANKTSKKLLNLTPSTKYQVKIRSVCDETAGTVSAFTNEKKFTTLPLKNSWSNEPVIADATIYPNPGAGAFQLALDMNEEGNVLISVFDLAGRIVYTSNSFVTAGEQTILFDLTGLSSGVYVTEVKLNNDKLVRKLVVE